MLTLAATLRAKTCRRSYQQGQHGWRFASFLKPLGLTQADFADRIGVSYVRLNEIINGRRGITPSTALRLAKALGTTPDFWLNSQIAIDLYRVSHDEEEIRQLERIEPVRA